MTRKVCGVVAALVLLVCVSAAQAENDAFRAMEQRAQGSTVRFFMYGGFANVNKWIDGWVASELKKRHGITLERVPMDAAVFVNRLLAEKSAGREQGTMDLLWINGENFRNARKAGLLWGPFAHHLPHINYVAPATMETDFGFAVEGYEAPWGRAQLVLEYDAARVPEPPRTMAALKEWIIRNPGRFTYPQPPDFTGSAFLRQVLFATCGGHQRFMKDFDQALYDSATPPLWAWLAEVRPHLWQEGRTYPRDAAAQDSLFARGEVDFAISYHPVHAQSRILDGTYPPTVRTVALEDGSIANTHFVAIPFNAPNKDGAVVVAAFLLSPDAQLAKLDPALWGDFPVLDMALLPKADAARFAGVDLGKATLPPADLARFSVPEIPAAWLEALEKGWNDKVLHAGGGVKK